MQPGDGRGRLTEAGKSSNASAVQCKVLVVLYGTVLSYGYDTSGMTARRPMRDDRTINVHMKRGCWSGRRLDSDCGRAIELAYGTNP